jgi:hypothetical protein
VPAAAPVTTSFFVPAAAPTFYWVP